MQIFKVTLIIFLLFLPFPIKAAEKWEICLDEVDFKFDFDKSLLSMMTVSKAKCRIEFIILGGKGEKFLIDVCDPNIHIDHSLPIDAGHPERIAAGATGCPAPSFGADFSENQLAHNEFKQLKKRVFDLFERMSQDYGQESQKKDDSQVSSLSTHLSAGKVSCLGFLLREYLNKCMSFEPKKDSTKAKSSNIPGVHPQTILAPADVR